MRSDKKSEIKNNASLIMHRFRGYFPVIIDIETAGFNHQEDAILEIAAVTVKMDEQGFLTIDQEWHNHILPFENANIEKTALEFLKIRDPFSLLRGAIEEKEAFNLLFKWIRQQQKENQCKRAILVAHNAMFDLSFINAAINRNQLKRSPFHPFSSIDTVAFAALAAQHTVLSKACQNLHIDFDLKKAHNALYDAKKTAELFCTVINQWEKNKSL